jgi:hypothetical protein
MSRSWLDYATYAFVYGPGLVCLAAVLMKAWRLLTWRRLDIDPPDTDGRLDYFLDEAERLMAERRRVERQRDAMVLRNAANWPPTRQSTPKLPLLKG